MEPTTGIEPVDLFLTKEALYRLSYVGISIKPLHPPESESMGPGPIILERETRLELATSSLEG